MSTTYPDSYKDTSPVAVSPQRKRSSCSCVAAGCGCIVIVLVIAGIVLAVMWPRFKDRFMNFVNTTVEQQVRPQAQNAANDMADDPRVVEKLGAPVRVTKDDTEPFNVENPRWKFKLEGTKGTATGIVELKPDESGSGQWNPTKLEVTFEDGTTLDILEDPLPDDGPVNGTGPDDGSATDEADAADETDTGETDTGETDTGETDTGGSDAADGTDATDATETTGDTDADTP